LTYRISIEAADLADLESKIESFLALCRGEDWPNPNVDVAPVEAVPLPAAGGVPDHTMAPAVPTNGGHPPLSVTQTGPQQVPPGGWNAPFDETPEQPSLPAVMNDELDASGVPWDPRIHSKGKTKNKGSGLWREKRGVDDATKNAVLTELRARVTPTAPATVPAASVAVPPAAPTGPTMQALHDLGIKLYGVARQDPGTQPNSARAVIPARIVEVLQAHNCPNNSIQDLHANPNAIPAVYHALVELAGQFGVQV